MANSKPVAIVLRFRDLVTEQGGTISEHGKILRNRGYVWWGWWRRQSELVPRNVLADLFPDEEGVEIPIVLFDSGALELSISHSSRVVMAPGTGIRTPEADATPEYAARAPYPLWFRLERDISAMDTKSIRIVARPTLSAADDRLPRDPSAGEDVGMADLRDDRPTLWLAQL